MTKKDEYSKIQALFYRNEVILGVIPQHSDFLTNQK